jgi:hypothetical protein
MIVSNEASMGMEDIDAFLSFRDTVMSWTSWAVWESHRGTLGLRLVRDAVTGVLGGGGER